MAKRWADWRSPGPVPHEPALEPLFPITSFVPGSPCPHHGPIKDGSGFICMCCHNGSRRIERHPALQITPADRLALARFDEEAEPEDNSPTVYNPNPNLKGGI